MKLDDRTILREAQENLALCQLYETDIRAESKRCNQFLALEQWDENDLKAREGRPTVVIDQTGQYRDQVTADWRRNRLGVKVSPADEIADEDTARIYDGIVRQIEYYSHAHVAYDWAFECMTGGNRGFCRVITKRRPGSFRQDICIKKVPNPDAVYVDPFCDEIDYSDMRFALITEVVDRDEFKKRYKNAKLTDFADPSQHSTAWFPDSKSLIVAEYWFIVEKPRKIQLLTQKIAVIRNKQQIWADTVYDDEYETLPEGVEIMLDADGNPMEEDEPVREVWQYLLTGAEVLSKTKWLGSYIPIVPWYGKEIYYNGKRKLFSLISRSLDAQKIFNYAQSSMAERLGQAVRSPIIGVVGQFKSQRAAWEQSAQKAFAFLEYDPVAIGDKPADRPSRADFDPRIDQMIVAMQILKDNLRGTIGMNTNIGNQDASKAKSGRAIEALQREGDNATFDFLDNGGRALELVGSIIVDLIPKVYSEADILQIRDEQQKVIAIAVNQDIAQMPKPPEEQKRNFYLAEGKYHVTVSAAPSHQTLRQEGEEKLMQILEFLPPEAQKQAVPVILRLSDFYGAKELANTLDPPNDLKIPPAIQQQMQMMGKVIETLTQEVNELTKEREAKVYELDSKERTNRLDNDVKLAVAQIGAQVKENSDVIAAFMQTMDQQLKAIMQDRQLQHASETQDKELAHATVTQGQEHEFQERQAAMEGATEE